MKRVIAAVIFTALFGFGLYGMEMAGSSSMFMGYLSDVMSAEYNNGVRSDGVNLKLNPEKQTVKLMQQLPNSMSGYGIFIKNADNTYSFHRFDKKGTNLSKDLLKKTGKKAGITIHVMGKMKENILYVESIQEM